MEIYERDDELYHFGRKGMKWGQHIFGKVKAARTNRKRKKNLEKAREAKKTKAEEAAEKKRVLESGTASEVLKYKGQLSNKELSDAFNRLNYEKLISDISAKDSPQTKSGLEKVTGMLGKAEQGVSAYNRAAKLVNVFTKADLPIFEGNAKDKATEKAKKTAEKALDDLIKSGSAEDIAKSFGKFTSKQLQDATVRFTNEDKIRDRISKNKADADAAKKQADAQKQVEDYYNNVYLGKSSYSKSGKDLVDSTLKTSGSTKITGLLEDKSSSSGTLALGQTYIAGLLEDKSGGD